jgi:hypothetical protein
VNVRSFDVVKEPALNGLVRAIWPLGDRLLVQLVDGTASLISRGEQTRIEWSAPLADVRLIGAPWTTDAVIWVAGSRGELLALDRATGRVMQRKQCPQELSVGACEIGGTVWAVAVDGALYRVSDLPEVQP